MSKRTSLAFAFVAVVLSACTGTQQFANADFRPPEGDYRLIVLQPDISVGLLTAGGIVEPREDWTNQARDNVLRALALQQAKRGGTVEIAATLEDAGGDSTMLADLVLLHAAVGNSIRLHKYSHHSLPTKKDRFDWTLGEQAVQFGAATGYDYALFLRAADTFSSGGRIALQVASVLAFCAISPICSMAAGGEQAAFASLVDLQTGQIVWFNVLWSTVGDIRTPKGAELMVRTLLGEMRLGLGAEEEQGEERRQW